MVVQIECGAGEDGGLNVTFLLEVWPKDRELLKRARLAAVNDTIRQGPVGGPITTLNELDNVQSNVTSLLPSAMLLNISSQVSTARVK